MPESQPATASTVVRFAAVGAASTLAYALLFVILRGALGAAVANGVSLAVTAVGNTAANRRHTFRIRGRAGALRHHVAGAAVFVLTLGLTTAALGVLHGLDARPARWLELTVLVVASLAATITRYVALRSWVFAPRRERGGAVASTV
jgi:putative flippase GtrA